MRWHGLNLLVLGYGLAATLAGLIWLMGVGLIACVVIFWLGGAILTISIGTVRLVQSVYNGRTARLRPSNVISLDRSILPAPRD